MKKWGLMRFRSFPRSAESKAHTQVWMTESQSPTAQVYYQIFFVCGSCHECELTNSKGSWSHAGKAYEWKAPIVCMVNLLEYPMLPQKHFFFVFNFFSLSGDYIWKKYFSKYTKGWCLMINGSGYPGLENHQEVGGPWFAGKHISYLPQWFSKCGALTYNISITWKPVRSAKFQTPAYWIRNSQVGPAITLQDLQVILMHTQV